AHGALRLHPDEAASVAPGASLVTAPLESHLDSIPRPQCDQWLQFDRVSGDQAQTIALRYRCEHQLRLGQCEDVADAHPRATAERKVRIARTSRRARRSKTLRLEAQRIFPERLMPMRIVL